MRKIIFLFLALFILTACSQQEPEIKDDFKDDFSEKEEEYQQSIQDLQQEVENLKKEVEETKPSAFKYEADLRFWSEDDIVKGLADKNKDFKEAKWFVYNYRDDGHYYDLVGPIFPFDPFHELVYEKRNRELTKSHLRIFNLDPGNEGIANERFQTYLAIIDKARRTNSSLYCYEQTSCRETKLITCRKDDQTFYAWFAPPYLMTSRNDNKEVYETFLALYCEEARLGFIELTGSLIKNIKSFFYIK